MSYLEKKEENCHNSGNEGKKGWIKGGLLAGLCCLLPILIIAGLPLLGMGRTLSPSLALIICPLMHIGMIFFFAKSRKKGSCCGE